MSSFNHETGHLRQNSTRSGGKIIDEWTFRSVFEHEPPYTVRVSMVIDGEGARFVATCAQLPKEQLQSTDIEQLRRQTERKLKEYQLITSGAVWEDWLEVRVKNVARIYQESRANGVGGQSENGRGLDISYQPIKRGTHPAFPNRVFTINSNRIAVDFPAAKDAGVTEGDPRLESMFGGPKLDPNAPAAEIDPTSWRGKSGREDYNQYSYIPDTPENRASLDHLLRSMDQLGIQLQGFLANATVKENLHRLAALVDPLMPALPAPIASQDNAPFSDEASAAPGTPAARPRPR